MLIILKNQLNHQLNITTLKHFVYYKIFYKMLFFSTQIYLKVIFYTAKFKNLNIAHAPNEIKPGALNFFSSR